MKIHRDDFFLLPAQSGTIAQVRMAVQQQEMEFCVWNLKPDRLQSVDFCEIIALYNQKRYYLKKGGEKKEKEREQISIPTIQRQAGPGISVISTEKALV